MGGLQFIQRALDGAFLVGRQLVAVVLEVLLALENHAVGSVDFLNLLFRLLVVGGVGLGFGLHTLDFVVAQAAGGLDADVASSSSAGIPLALAGGLVHGADVEDAVPHWICFISKVFGSPYGVDHAVVAEVGICAVVKINLAVLGKVCIFAVEINALKNDEHVC